MEKEMSYITTVKRVKTIIPNQAVVNYLVKDYIIEEKIENVTIMMQAFLDHDYQITSALIASLLGIEELNIKHIGITDITEVYYIAPSGEYYGSPIQLTADIDYNFKTFDFILDEVYNVSSYTIGLSREFIEQTIYGGIFESKNELGFIQYKVVGGNDDQSVYQISLSVLGYKAFFMDSILQQIQINSSLSGEGAVSDIIQLLAAYIVAKDIIVEYILPVFKQDIANNLAGVQLNAKDLLPGFEAFLDSLNDKIADMWALLKYKGKITVNPDGPDGPEAGTYADKAKTVVRGEKNYTFETPFNDSNDYHRRSNNLDDFLFRDLWEGI
jgi:hypothetical protein